jgi:outer membrane receptor protein involved in Fe transport
MEWLRSDGERQIAVMTNSTSLPLPDRLSALREQLDYEERALAVYAHQLFGELFAVGLRYRLTETELDTRLPGLDSAVTGLEGFTRDDTARLHTWQITGRWTHPGGTFAEWRSEWYHQERWDHDGHGPSEEFWQHDLFVGYRLPQRHAEIRLGILNLADADYRLNPLSRHRGLPRERTFTADLRLNF